jgi:hypothetical protein
VFGEQGAVTVAVVVPELSVSCHVRYGVWGLNAESPSKNRGRFADGLFSVHAFVGGAA